VTGERESAGRYDTQAVVVPTQRHLDLYQLLLATSHQDEAGRLVSWWPQTKLAAKLGVSVRTLQNLLADLREPGGDPRHRRGQPAGRRLGLLLVTPTMRKDPATGGRLYAGNLYALTPGRHATLAESVSAAQNDTQEGGVACLNKKAPAGGGYQGDREEVERESALSEPIEIAVEPPDEMLLDHDPDVSEILATLGDTFGDVQVLSGPAAYRTARGRMIDLATASTQDLRQALDQLDRHTCRRLNGDGTERCTADQRCGRHTARRRAQ
jgi:YD repeat-containing protein